MWDSERTGEESNGGRRRRYGVLLLCCEADEMSGREGMGGVVGRRSSSPAEKMAGSRADGGEVRLALQ